MLDVHMTDHAGPRHDVASVTRERSFGPRPSKKLGFGARFRFWKTIKKLKTFPTTFVSYFSPASYQYNLF